MLCSQEKLLWRADVDRLLVLQKSLTFPNQKREKITALTNHVACHPGSLAKHALEKTEDQKYSKVWCKCHYDTTYPNPETGEQVDEESAISIEKKKTTQWKSLKDTKVIFFLASHFNARSKSAFFKTSLVPKEGCLNLCRVGPWDIGLFCCGSYHCSYVTNFKTGDALSMFPFVLENSFSFCI